MISVSERVRMSRLKTEDIAKELLGWELALEAPEGIMKGIIVETEAYITGDKANHAYKGPTLRNRAMFGPFFSSYIYRLFFSYCFNIVTHPGEAVLIRALLPTQGVNLMLKNREAPLLKLCSGPGNLCKAFHIDHSLNSHALWQSPFFLTQKLLCPINIKIGSRIGTRDISLLRFFIDNCPFISFS